ncbi:selenoneine biosynthesis selenosugar synthase SenB [Massilia sp. CF038]|uniref:selenoneine biosynthesis selenosugar synthase SenB n=1 Tax=Massilia sp. CF038 TaxID=1881045 RepID=UPI001E608D19|nr:selenoneine biosynthesis selenosugar synthase SenB [Massilia sp. CF038]
MQEKQEEKQVLIASPAGAKENNGNWQTASRWASFLRERYQVSIVASADYGAGTLHGAAADADLFIALHARRSAAALAAFAQTWPARPRVLVLTGTDLYRDIHHDPTARAALEHATDLVLLQSAGVAVLPAGLRARLHVIHQSAPCTQAGPALTGVDAGAGAGAGEGPQDKAFSICMVGHLRPEKDPLTFMRASTLVHDSRIHLQHIGRALDPDLGAAAAAASASHARYEWLGDQPHATTRALLARSHAMVLCSLMEGGANVIIEALTSDVPVLASDINGNRGMLGEDYAGYFPPGDVQALAALIERSVADPAFHAQLLHQCRARAPLFAPAAERAAVLSLAERLLAAPPAAAHAPPEP